MDMNKEVVIGLVLGFVFLPFIFVLLLYLVIADEDDYEYAKNYGKTPFKNYRTDNYID